MFDDLVEEDDVSFQDRLKKHYDEHVGPSLSKAGVVDEFPLLDAVKVVPRQGPSAAVQVHFLPVYHEAADKYCGVGNDVEEEDREKLGKELFADVAVAKVRMKHGPPRKASGKTFC